MTDKTAAPVDGVIQATEIAGSAVAHDMSVIGMFFQAGFVVQAVVVLLIFASIWCWAITIEKYTRFNALKLNASRFEKEFWKADSVDSFHDKVRRKKIPTPIEKVFLVAMEEWTEGKGKVRKTGPASISIGIRDRIAQMMSVARNRELDKLEQGLGLLATVGSSAPFVGLFGTVWGIMNSFTSIAASKNTNLAVVAPGIAEALAATAIGLVVAIPAVVAYNKFSGELGRYAGRMEDFSTEFLTLIGRKMD